MGDVRQKLLLCSVLSSMSVADFVVSSGNWWNKQVHHHSTRDCCVLLVLPLFVESKEGDKKKLSLDFKYRWCICRRVFSDLCVFLDESIINFSLKKRGVFILYLHSRSAKPRRGNLSPFCLVIFLLSFLWWQLTEISLQCVAHDYQHHNRDLCHVDNTTCNLCCPACAHLSPNVSLANEPVFPRMSAYHTDECVYVGVGHGYLTATALWNSWPVVKATDLPWHPLSCFTSVGLFWLISSGCWR